MFRLLFHTVNVIWDRPVRLEKDDKLYIKSIIQVLHATHAQYLKSFSVHLISLCEKQTEIELTMH